MNMGTLFPLLDHHWAQTCFVSGTRHTEPYFKVLMQAGTLSAVCQSSLLLTRGTSLFLYQETCILLVMASDFREEL